jgi:L,D-transpeptidase YcbB
LSGNVATFVDAVRPQHPEYAALQTALTALRAQTATGWPTVPRATLRLGQWNKAVIPLRGRLAAAGYLPASAPLDSAHFDADVEAAVRAFQEHHALPSTGKLDPMTVAALNIPLVVRLSQVAMNLERWRWLPDDLGSRHFIVNIPYFHLIARENRKPVLDIRTVVGKRGNETPIFSDEMTHVVFSPYWNIPESIALEETAPAVARDPDYLERNNIEVISTSGRVVSPSSIPWDDEQALNRLSFRQRPGATNALGYVKFMFPNKHHVYLHDTPSDALFRRLGRAFSHGCVRVEEPEALAQYVLREQPEWTPQAIHAAMRAGEERHVKLREPIPVHIIYMTAWVDEGGGLHFQNDVYGYDAKQARAWAALARK